MKTFSIDSKLRPFLDRIPEKNHRPVIGITANYENIDATLREPYYNQVVAAGGVPVIIPPVDDVDTIDGTLESIDGLLLSGGGDINPLWSGEEPVSGLHNINAKRDAAELMTVRLAYDRQIPMLGICRGCQVLAASLGGHVCQDWASTGVKHSQDADRSLPTHTVTVKEGTLVHGLLADGIAGDGLLYVNSFHHQVVDETGERLKVAAVARDGAIEAVESPEYKNIIGVQWHPEWLGEDGQPLFKWLVESAREYREACSIHDRLLTLDTHCDTPMFFPQGVDFLKRDDNILVDLYKMTVGRQDATTMVAYIPQSMADNGAGITPFHYADSIFDEIEKIVERSQGTVALARNPEELYANKQRGSKSIVLGIENGLALEGCLDNVSHFASRGVTYITLCHNGDNDICDSAKGTATHGGVSAFGADVIKEMNRLGIMVDLSHASESSFYDALSISSTPIVCSHSNCRALCDHPRNLTDDQLMAIAKVGGVAHTTFYHGFLSTAKEADILDAVAHLEHAIGVMGIEHVGIGTDFDGDGGVRGMRSSAEIMQFTMQLLRKRYSETDLAMIWGGNWLRVMEQVQKKN